MDVHKDIEQLSAFRDRDLLHQDSDRDQGRGSEKNHFSLEHQVAVAFRPFLLLSIDAQEKERAELSAIVEANKMSLSDHKARNDLSGHCQFISCLVVTQMSPVKPKAS